MTLSNISQKSDEDLMRLVTDKNTSAFEILYQRYEMAIFNLILRYTGNKGLSQDLLQETFTRVWVAAHLYSLEKGKFKTWVYTIALNITRNEMVKKQYSFSYLEITEMNFEACVADSGQRQPDKKIENDELQKNIQHALSMLPPLLREITILKHYQELTFREIAYITNTPEGTLKARFHRAISLLKEYIVGVNNGYSAS